MKRILILILFTPILLSSSCETEDFQETVCEIKRYADLLIPELIYIYDALYNPVIINGQHVYDQNEYYYNYRTGELFTHLFGPQAGVWIGDVLDIGTRVFNNWADDNCNKGANAPASSTEPSVNVYDPYGNPVWGSTGNPHYTPPINQNAAQGGFTFTSFQVGSPGYHQFDWNANYNQLFDEHGFGNNLYFGNNGGWGSGRAVAQGGFEVIPKPIPGAVKWHNPDKPEEVAMVFETGVQYTRGTTEETYLDSPLARFMQEEGAMEEFYRFKAEHPDEPFILK